MEKWNPWDAPNHFKRTWKGDSLSDVKLVGAVTTLKFHGVAMAATTRTDYACSVCTKTFGDHSRCAKHVNAAVGACRAKGAKVIPISIHFSINDRNVGGRLGQQVQQHRGLQNDAVGDLDLDMEGPGADGEPECLSGILNHPSESFMLIYTYLYLSYTIPINPIRSASPRSSGFVTQIRVDKSR